MRDNQQNSSSDVAFPVAAEALRELMAQFNSDD
ncbi:hypothetical protein OKW46_001159 [Paraburkholderia sp. WSM4179]|nr:hypothetical protein [Paraburkholderia sp. WSM4179]